MKLGLIALVIAWGAVRQSPPPGASPAPEQQMLRLTNLERERAGLPGLEWNAKLAQAAQAHSRRLASHEGLSHQFAGEPALVERVSATGARVSALAENVAVAGSPDEAHQALMNSPGHRANILSSEYNAMGIAVVWVGGDMYVTEDFARVVPVYSAEQFRDAVVAAFNRARQDRRIAPVDSRADPQLDRAACATNADPRSLLGRLPGATQATIFTASDPAELPPAVIKAASDFSVKRMSIGVCFRTDASDNFSKFWVVAAFYPTPSWPAPGAVGR
jgi:hypothetical protein